MKTYVKYIFILLFFSFNNLSGKEYVLKQEFLNQIKSDIYSEDNQTHYYNRVFELIYDSDDIVLSVFLLALAKVQSNFIHARVLSPAYCEGYELAPRIYDPLRDEFRSRYFLSLNDCRDGYSNVDSLVSLGSFPSRDLIGRGEEAVTYKSGIFQFSRRWFFRGEEESNFLSLEKNVEIAKRHFSKSRRVVEQRTLGLPEKCFSLSRNIDPQIMILSIMYLRGKTSNISDSECERLDLELFKMSMGLDLIASKANDLYRNLTESNQKEYDGMLKTFLDSE